MIHNIGAGKDLSESKSKDISRLKAERAERALTAVSVRVSPHSYLGAVMFGTFFAALCFYLHLDLAGALIFGVSWIVIPFLAMSDRVSFDGKRLSRDGLMPRVWSWLNGSRRKLKIADIEQAETFAVRAIRRGGSVVYRYRTVLRGKGVSVAIASGGEDFRRMIHSILPRLPENVLDNRSIELRDHLTDPKETLMKAEFARIPSADVLEGSLRSRPGARPSAEVEEEKADDLRELANELKLTGHLPQALEAFRRALVLRPLDARLLFEFARCLHSFAGTTRDRKLAHRALAASRLSERRAGSDGDLLARLGEWYFEIGDAGRASSVFQRVTEKIGENFRAARGLAEIALRDGKIAHVIHQFATAGRMANTHALRRWSRSEADYFSNLNADEEYLEMEISRVNLLETVERSQRVALRIAVAAFPAVMIGVLFDDALIAQIGWAVSAVCLVIWCGLVVTARMLSTRIPYELMGSDD